MGAGDGEDKQDFRAAASFVLMLRQAGLRDTNVLRAMEQVPRVPFLDERYALLADEDVILPIKAGQTLLPPSLVATMVEALGPLAELPVLLIGAGSGYTAAILSRLAGSVVAVERSALLADEAHERLRSLGYDRIEVVYGDGLEGYASRAPYGAILSSVALDGLPPALLSQLAPEGVLVAPLGQEGGPQTLTRIRKRAHGVDSENLRTVHVQGAQAGVSGQGLFTRPQ
jgi:protein-L-isoaspartate(D-aspartate) O-methyltransferase